MAHIPDYCRGLFECPITFSFFVTRQHAHLFSRHITVCSCLQTAHTHGCSEEKVRFGCERYLVSRYSQRVAAETPAPKIKASVLILRRNTNREMAKRADAIRTIHSHRLAKSILCAHPSRTIHNESALLRSMPYLPLSCVFGSV
jgi:hypothetical protein